MQKRIKIAVVWPASLIPVEDTVLPFVITPTGIGTTPPEAPLAAKILIFVLMVLHL